MRAPSVSIITPVFNPGVFLRPAVESVLAQSHADFELLLADDGSTDGSREWLRTLNDPRVRVLENPVNLGPAATRNRALAEVRGEFVAFLNHDDVAAPNRLERQVTYFRAHPETGLLGGSLRVREVPSGRESTWTGAATARDIRWRGLLDCPMRLSTLMVRREAIQAHGLLFNPQWAVHTDYDWVMRAARAVPAANLPEALATAYRHPGSLSIRRAAALQDAATRIAFESIRAELPDFPIDLDAVAGLRTALAGSPGERRTLAFTKRMLDIQLNLLAAFHAKFPDGPAIAVKSGITGFSDHA
jgi:glycosyltransferase involved in cell wall biosynthesis